MIEHDRSTPISVVLQKPHPVGARGMMTRLIYTVIMLAVRSWVVMLALGVAHTVWAQVPPLGYWTVVVLLIGLNYLSGRDYAFDPRWKDAK